MRKIPTLYSDYQECILDLDIYGKLVSAPQQSIEDLTQSLFEEFKRGKPSPNLESKRYELSRLVSPDYRIAYDKELELQDGESLVELDNINGNLGLVNFEDLTPLIPEVQEAFSYEMNITDAVRKEIISKYDLETGEEFKPGIRQTENIVGSVKEDDSLILSDEEIENLGVDDYDSYTEEDDDVDDYDSYTEEGSEDEVDDYESYSEDNEEDIDDYDSYAKEDEENEVDDYDNYTEEVDEDEVDNYDNYSEEDSEDSEDEIDDYDSYSEEVNEDEVDDHDSYSEEDSISENIGVVNNENSALEEVNNRGSTSEEFLDSVLDELNPSDFIEPIIDKHVETPVTPAQIHNDVPNVEIIDRSAEPTDIRAFLRKHPRCDYDFVLKYFTKKQINDAIKIGKIIKKGNILKI